MSSFYSLAPMKSLDSSLATRIVVVGGAKASGAALALTDSTNRGQLVDIVAPGEYVPGLSPNGVVGFKFGTSFAAPLVSGVAAALTAFDPTLTASTLKQYLINGAKNGRYQVADVTRTDSIPMLDMYESLKLAATQPGTPLCGNRVWNDGNNQIMAERGNSTEPLFSRPGTDYAAFTNPFHGGRRIEVGFSYQYKYSQSTRDWSQDTYVPAGDSSFGGAYLSYTYAADHDNKIWTTRIDTTDATGQQISVTLVDAGSRNLRKDFGSQHVPFTMPAPPATCIMEYPIGANGNISVPANNFVGYQCTGYAPSGSWSSIATTGGVSLTPIIAVPSPQADFILVPVSVRQQTALYTPLREVCNAADTLNNNITQTDSIRRCANLTFRVDSSLRAFVYRIDTLTGQWRQIPLDDAGNTTREGREINSLSISEDGKQMMLSMTRRVNFSSWLVDDAACHDETLEWIALDSIPGTNKGAGAVLKVVNLPQGKSCGGWVEAGGTVSPFRAPRVSGGAVLTSRSGGSLRSPFAARSARLAVPGAPASEQRSPGARQSVAPPFTSSKSQ